MKSILNVKIFLIFAIVLFSNLGCTNNPEVKPTPTPILTPTNSTNEVPHEEVDIEPWYQVYGGDYENFGSDCLILPDQGFLIVGGIDQFDQPGSIGGVMLLRTDMFGNELWKKVYGGQGFDAGWDIAEALDGGYIIAGESTSFGNGESDGYVIKLDEVGEVEWEKSFGGDMKEVFNSVSPVQERGYILTGNIVDPEDFITDPGAAGYGGFAGRSNIYLVMIGLDGEQEWTQIIKSEMNTIATDVLVAQNGSIYVLASVIKYPATDDDLLLLKFDQEGNLLWTHTWEDGGINGNALAEDLSGNLIITGYSSSENETKSDVFLLKVDSDGNELWFNEYGRDILYEIGKDVLVLEDGNYAVLTYKTLDFYSSMSSLSILVVDNDGNKLWESTIELNNPIKGVSFQLHPEGGFVITGSLIDINQKFRTLLIRTNLQGYID